MPAKHLSDWLILESCRHYIADAEEAARKAQNIALKAAEAFGEVAAKFNRSLSRLN